METGACPWSLYHDGSAHRWRGCCLQARLGSWQALVVLRGISCFHWLLAFAMLRHVSLRSISILCWVKQRCLIDYIETFALTLGQTMLIFHLKVLLEQWLWIVSLFLSINLRALEFLILSVLRDYSQFPLIGLVPLARCDGLPQAVRESCAFGYQTHAQLVLFLLIYAIKFLSFSKIVSFILIVQDALNVSSTLVYFTLGRLLVVWSDAECPLPTQLWWGQGLVESWWGANSHLRRRVL